MDSEKIVQKKLTDMGFTVHKIQESIESRTPDFHAEKHGECYLVEVKSKFDSEEEIKRQKQSYTSNEIHVTSKRFKRSNRISGIISDACEQLQEYSKSRNYLRLVWLQASGLCDSIQSEEFLYSIYGAVMLNSFSWDGEQEPEFKNCLFFSHSDFYNHREHLDGIIIGKSNSGLLCLNPCSPNYNKLKSGELFKAMYPFVIDPNILEEEGKAYVINSSANRNNRSLMLKEVQQKYGIKYLSIAISEGTNNTFWVKKSNK